MGVRPVGTTTKTETFISLYPSEAFSTHPKKRVIEVEVNGHFKAYPFVELPQAKYPLEDLVNGQKLFLEFNIKTRNGIIRDDRDRVLPSINAFWFTWYTFHPKKQIFRSSN